MAGIKILSTYRNKVCGCCHYSWDYPSVRKELLDPLQNLYYFEINVCPTCNCIGKEITQVGEYEKNIQKKDEYKEITKTRNIPFSYVQKKEAYEYVLYAYICEQKGDFESYIKAYLMASIIEQEQREKYIQSLAYDDEKDRKLIEDSKKTQIKYLENSLSKLQQCLDKNSYQKVNEGLILSAYINKLLGNEEACMKILNFVAKNKLTNNEVLAVKQIVGVKK